jgi:hypothetical protein
MYISARTCLLNFSGLAVLKWRKPLRLIPLPPKVVTLCNTQFVQRVCLKSADVEYSLLTYRLNGARGFVCVRARAQERDGGISQCPFKCK